MTAPLVSVLLPYRDVETTIDEALDGVLAERGDVLELIAIDDGSVDGSAARVAHRAAQDRRIVAVEGPGRGIAAALRLGLEVARAPEWIARMDGDDVWVPGRLEAQVDALRAHPSLGAVGTLIEAFPDEAVAGGMRRYVAWQNALRTPDDHVRDLFVEAPLCHPSVMLRRRALVEVGGFRDVDWPEDYDLWMRLHAAGHTLGKVDLVGLRWRQREGRLTFSDPRYGLDRHRAMKAHFLASWIGARSAHRLVVWGAGPTGRRFARALEADGRRVGGWVDIDPRKIGRLARGKAIGPPEQIDPGRDAVLVALGSEGARLQVRAHLEAHGWVEGDHFLCVS